MVSMGKLAQNFISSKVHTIFLQIVVATTIFFWICRLKQTSHSCRNTCKFTYITHFFLQQLFKDGNYLQKYDSLNTSDCKYWPSPSILSSLTVTAACIFLSHFSLRLILWSALYCRLANISWYFFFQGFNRNCTLIKQNARIGITISSVLYVCTYVCYLL